MLEKFTTWFSIPAGIVGGVIGLVVAAFKDDPGAFGYVMWGLAAAVVVGFAWGALAEVMARMNRG